MHTSACLEEHLTLASTEKKQVINKTYIKQKGKKINNVFHCDKGRWLFIFIFIEYFCS